MVNNPVQSREKHDYFSNFPAETNHWCHFNCSTDFCSISKTVTKDTSYKYCRAFSEFKPLLWYRELR